MTKIVNNPQQLTLFGEKTPRAVLYKSESHKLHQAFRVKDGAKIVQGMPVAITADGSIEPYIENTQVYIGISITDNQNPAYQPQRDFPIEVTVAMEGFAIVNWVSNGEIDCGYVIPSGDLLNDRYVKANQAVDTQFIAISSADDANELIQVIIK